MEPEQFKQKLAEDEQFADSVADEVATKMEEDPEIAEAVAKGLSEHDGVAQKMLDDTPLAAKLAEQMLTDDIELVDKVRREMELEGFHLETPRDEDYTPQSAKKDMVVAARANFKQTDPEVEAEKAGHRTSVWKSTQETNFTNAGLTIPTPLAEEIIPILDSEPVFIDAGAEIMTLPQGKLDLGRQNQDPTANWQGEGATISTSDTDHERLTLTSHKLTVGHNFSNDYLRRDGAILTEDWMFSRMMRAARNKLDTTLLEGGGGNNEPEGLIVQTASGQVRTTSGNSITNVADDIKTQHRDLAGADIPNERRRIFMRPEVRIDLAYDINSNEDTFPFRDEIIEEGTILDADIRTTTNIDLDGSNNSNVYLCEMTEMLVGRGTDFEMASSADHNFLDDQTTLRLVSHWDFQMAHDQAASIIEDYTLQ